MSSMIQNVDDVLLYGVTKGRGLDFYPNTVLSKHIVDLHVYFVLLEPTAMGNPPARNGTTGIAGLLNTFCLNNTNT